MVDLGVFALVFNNELVFIYFEFRDNILELDDFFAFYDLVFDNGLFFLD